MSPENRALLMRANRLMGASLVEANLVKIEDLLEKANEKLFEIIAAQNVRQSLSEKSRPRSSPSSKSTGASRRSSGRRWPTIPRN